VHAGTRIAAGIAACCSGDRQTRQHLRRYIGTLHGYAFEFLRNVRSVVSLLFGW
jgi:hypothetical protein